MVPSGATATPAGSESRAAVAGPSSPRLVPPPAIVWMVPSGAMRRTRLALVSATTTTGCPAPSSNTATAWGDDRRAEVAGPPSSAGR